MGNKRHALYIKQCTPHTKQTAIYTIIYINKFVKKYSMYSWMCDKCCIIGRWK